MSNRTGTTVGIVVLLAALVVGGGASLARQQTAPATATDLASRFDFPERAPLAPADSLVVGFTGSTAVPAAAGATVTQPEIPYGLLGLCVSSDGRYVGIASTWTESQNLTLLDGATGLPRGRVDGWYQGRAIAVGQIAWSTPGGRGEYKDATGAPVSGWAPGVLTAGVREAQVGARHSGVVYPDESRSYALGPDTAWNEDRYYIADETTNARIIADVALCRGDSLVVFADATPGAPRLMLFDRARPFRPDETAAADKYTDPRRWNTFLRPVRNIPLPSAPLRVAPAPDGSSAWVILDAGEGKPRPVLCVSLEDGRELLRLTVPADVVPEDIAVSPSRLLAVADSGLGRNIRLFDARTGKARGELGTRGGILAAGPLRGRVRAGAFAALRSLDIDAAGNLYVLDSLSNGLAPRIVSYSPDAADWDMRTARWVAQGQIIGGCPVFDPADPGTVYMCGIEGRTEVKAASGVGGWKAVRLVAPFGGWGTLPASIPESRIPRQETGVLRVGGKVFLVHSDYSGRLAVTEPDTAMPYFARPCWLLDNTGVWTDGDDDGRLDPKPVEGLPDVLSGPAWKTEYVARYRIDLSDGSLWAWNLYSPPPYRVTRFPLLGLDKTGCPSWDWSAGRGITVPGLQLAPGATAPRDFVPVRDAAGAALYVWSTAAGEPLEDYHLQRYAVDLTGGTCAHSWDIRTGPYQIYNRDAFHGQIGAAGRDGALNRPIGFSVPSLSRFVFLAYNTGIQAEAVDVATGRGVALLRSDHSPQIWEDSPAAAYAMRLPKSGQRPETYVVGVNENFHNRTALYRWQPGK